MQAILEGNLLQFVFMDCLYYLVVLRITGEEDGRIQSKQ